MFCKFPNYTFQLQVVALNLQLVESKKKYEEECEQVVQLEEFRKKTLKVCSSVVLLILGHFYG